VALIGLYLIASGLLVVAGLAKAVQPDGTARALAALATTRRRAPAFTTLRQLVRLGALAEVAVGALALAVPRPLTAGLVALSYLAFTVVVAYAGHLGGPLATCGCFGQPDTPPTVVHLLLDLVLAASAALFVLGAPRHGTLVAVLTHQPWVGLPLLFVVTVGAWLTSLAMTALARLEGARRLVRPSPPGSMR
jgi:hypothetical protein